MIRTLGWGLVLVMAAPLVVVAWVSFSPDAFLTLPTDDWSGRWYRAFGQNRRWLAATGRSLMVASLATTLSLSVGVPLAVALRRPFRGRTALHLAALLPLGVPAVALAAGWLPIAVRLGGAGQSWPLVLAHAALSLPIVLLVVGRQLAATDPQLVAAARTLGATPAQVVWRILLPLAGPGILAAAASGFVLSMNEAIVSVFLATPRTETLPAVVWATLRQNPTPLAAVAAVLNGTLALGAVLLLPRRLSWAGNRS